MITGLPAVPDHEEPPDDWPPERWEAMEEQRDGPTIPRPIDRMRAALVVGDAIKDLPPTSPIVGDTLDLDSLAALFGPSGVGKSLVGLGLSAGVATARSWFGRAVVAGDVLYVTGEGARGMGARLEAWQQHHRVDDVSRLTWLTMAPPLTDPSWAADFAELVGERQPSLVVIDTLSRSLVGADENSAKDMGQAVAALDGVRRASGACVLVIHHTGKDTTAGMRGSSVLRAAVDTELEVAGGSGTVIIRSTKQRDRAVGEALYLRMVPVAESVVLVPTERQVEPEPYDGPLQCTLAVRHLFEETLGPGEELSQSAVPKRLRDQGASYRDHYVRDALERLVNERVLDVRTGARGARLYRLATPQETLDV